jgi:potassium-dependent mechanosensitive channel
LINSTLSNRRYGIELPIAVAHGTDAKSTIALLEQTAASHPLITRDPPPKAVVVKLGVDAINIELRAWTDRTEHWMDVRSELAIAISSAFAADGVVVQ